MADPEGWPPRLPTEPKDETKGKITKEVFVTAVETKNDLDDLLKKNNYWTMIRVTVWIRRLQVEQTSINSRSFDDD